MATELGDVPGCQNTGVQSPPLSRPWRGSEYASEYEQVWQYVLTNRYNGHPTRFIEAVRSVYGGDYTNTEYKRLLRFVERTAWLHTVDCGGYKEVEPTTKGLGLESTVSISQKRRTGAGSDTSQGKLGETGSGESTTDTPATAEPAESYPKDRVNNLREKVVRLDGGSSGHDYRQEVFRELVQYREDTADKFTMLENRVRDEYLLLPYQTRFNTRHKAKSSQSRFRTALDTASEGFRTAAVLTLTVDPTRFESHTEATEGITDGVANLRNCLQYRTGGFEAVSVFDFQRNGLPHIHLVLFGVSVVEDGTSDTGEATVSEAEVREYWDENAGIGSQVAVQPAWKRGGDWVLHDDDKKVSLRYYLGKRIRELIQVAEMDESELWEAVEDGDIELWRHALFWVTQKQYVSCSGSLKESESDDGDELPYVPEWEYVGTAKYEQIPRHIIENATVVRTRSRTSATG
jgi:hypothetical protein